MAAKGNNRIPEAVQQGDAEERTARCAQELDAVLKKHRCVLEAVVMLGPGPQGIQRSVQVVPLP